jgi:4-amino-4-deoxy-L-arabinose transferase-like glycosyltransferase
MMLKRWLPVALVLMAFAMRTAWLAEVPPGLHHDEVIYTSIAEKALGGGWSIFYPEGQGREGFYIPFLAAALRWLGTGAFALRVPSVFLSVLGLCAVYALTRRLFGSSVALFALAEMSFTFWSLFPGRVAMRAVTEPLVAALAAYALWVAVHKAQVGGRRPDSTIRSLGFVVAGLLIGLTVYTYRGARALPAIVVALPLYLALFDRATLRRTWRGLFVCAVVVVMVAAPLVILLTTHPGLDQLGWAGRDRVLRALSAGDGRPMLSTTAATLGAFFFRGDPDDYYNLGGRPVFGLVTGALFAVGVLLALKRIRQLRYAYLLMWFALALAPGMVSEPAPHFYRILGAQMAAFAFPGISLQNLKSKVSNLKGRAIHLKLEAWYLILVLALVAADGLWNARDYFMIWGARRRCASCGTSPSQRSPAIWITLRIRRPSWFARCSSTARSHGYGLRLISSAT